MDWIYSWLGVLRVLDSLSVIALIAAMPGWAGQENDCGELEIARGLAVAEERKTEWKRYRREMI